LSEVVAGELLERLIAFPSTAGRPNGDIAGFIRVWLEARGVAYTVATDPGGTQVNLLAETGPERAGVLLAAHMDVVAADPAGWRCDPYRRVERDGRLCGRGSTDMKGFWPLPWRRWRMRPGNGSRCLCGSPFRPTRRSGASVSGTCSR
jgi:acetylornithine deacetylase/succinyl-diaminopimelate desuccinylase-like protein